MLKTALRRTIWLSAVIVLVLATVAGAAAHAAYVRSVPAQGAQLSSAPAQVTAYFAETLDMAASSLTVTNAAGATVSQGTAQQLPSDVKAMQIALQPNLAPGTYTVQWKTRSAVDGDDANGSFTFTVVTSSTASTQANTGATQLPTTGALPAGVPGLLLTLIGLLLLLGGLALRRRSIRHTASAERP
jgi:methionine-rich copper-binding protein CopC